MATLTIEMPEEQIGRLDQLAKELNVTVHELARMQVSELLERPDPEFMRMARSVADNNAELIRRLAG